MRLRPLHRNRSVARRLPPIAERLGDMDAADLLGTGEIGDRPSNAKHAVEAARGEAHRRRGVGEELSPWLIWRRHAVEKLAVGLGVRPRSVPVVAIRLQLPSGCDPSGYLPAALRRGRKREIGG